MSFEEKLGHTRLKPAAIYIYVMGLIPTDWKHKIKKESSQESLIKISCFNNKGTRKIKDFQKIFYK